MKIRQIVLSALIVLMSFTASAMTTVKLQVLDDGKAKQSGVGTLITDEILIINNLLIEQGNQYIVTAPESGAELIGTVIARDELLDVAIVLVKGLKGTPAIFALEPLLTGRNVLLVGASGKSRKGTVHSYVSPESEDELSRVQHTALLTVNDFGAPLLNNCGDLTGVSVSEKRGLFDSRLKVSSTFATATELQSLKDFLSNHDTSISVAETKCLSDAEQLAALEVAKQAQQEELTKKEEAQKSVEAELEKTRKESAEKEKALEVAELEKQEKEDARKAAEEALNAAQDETLEQKQKLEEAEQAKLEQEDRLKATEEAARAERERLETEKAAEQKKLYYYAIPILILLLILLFAFQQRRKKLQSAEQEASANRHQVSVEKAKFESAQEELEQASATFEDIVLLGTDEDGNEQRVKILGNTLARTSDGIVVGRSAQKATYVINVPGVSREHLRITLQGSTVFVEDLGSANGTEVNGQNLSLGRKLAVGDGDTLKIGTVDCTVHFLNT